MSPQYSVKGKIVEQHVVDSNFTFAWYNVPMSQLIFRKSPCTLHLVNPFYFMDFPIHIDTISMGMHIVYFKGSLVEFSKL